LSAADFLELTSPLKATLGGVVFDEVSEVVGGDDIAHRDDFDVFTDETLFDQRPEDQAANAAEPIDCYFHCHNFDFSSGLKLVKTSVRQVNDTTARVNAESDLN
jgi:hypothetical protein